MGWSGLVWGDGGGTGGVGREAWYAQGEISCPLTNSPLYSFQLSIRNRIRLLWLCCSRSSLDNRTRKLQPTVVRL